MKRLTTKEFVEKAKQTHGDKYNYSETLYKNSRTKVSIICLKHGKFNQIPYDHLKGCGCIKCSGYEKLTTKDFIDRANKIHNNKYDYSKTNYINSQTKVTITCKEHGEFKQIPRDHFSGFNCDKCRRLSQSDFINKANEIHNSKYNYSKSKYINGVTDIIIICEKHGEFKQRANHHLYGHGCSKCNCENKKSNIDHFIKLANKIHNLKYDYSKAIYTDAHTKTIIICKKHGEFLQTPNNHLNNHGCPKCSFRISKGEKRWLNELEKENNIIIERNLTIYINGKRFYPDGFHKPTNTWYEYNGNFFHGNSKTYNPNNINPKTGTTFKELYQNTLEKEKLIKKAGYNLITKWGN